VHKEKTFACLTQFPAYTQLKRHVFRG